MRGTRVWHRRALTRPLGAVPPLIGLTADQAEAALTAHGFEVGQLTGGGEGRPGTVTGPAGLVLRSLEADKSTLVNGQAQTLCTLQEGDLLSIGPFQFQVHLPRDPRVAGGTSSEQEKRALRIQAAAVAAHDHPFRPAGPNRGARPDGNCRPHLAE